MKKLRFVLLIAVLPLLASFAKTNTAELIVKTQFYCDHFEVCESKTKLEKDIAFTKGIKLVTIDSKAMTIKVVYNPAKTDPQKIRLAISKSGFDADEIKADPKAVEKLDQCCRKKE